jgi:dolichol-phosphate mannosyltransferase
MELCILIPAKDEEHSIQQTVSAYQHFLSGKIDFNILVIDDHSTDNSEIKFEQLSSKYSNFKVLKNTTEPGVGNAIRFGLSKFQGDVITICMADGSDAIENVYESYKKIKFENFDCVFGSRFMRGSSVSEYPCIKRVLNRIFNKYVKIKSGYPYNDFTNIFKTYSKDAIEKIVPLSSEAFSIGLEMSLKAFKNNLKIIIIPISWEQRKAGKSKLNLMKNIRLYFKTLKVATR